MVSGKVNACSGSQEVKKHLHDSWLKVHRFSGGLWRNGSMQWQAVENWKQWRNVESGRMMRKTLEPKHTFFLCESFLMSIAK